MSHRSLTRSALALALAASTAPASAGDWVVDSERSTLGFLSTKNVDFAEAHRFRELTGTVDDAGAARIVIDLTSVDTKVPIRDERMQEHVLDTATDPTAEVTANLDLETYEALEVGESMRGDVRFSLDFRGQTTPLLARVEVTRVDGGSLQVATLDPILLSAANLGVAPGVQKLREIAGLNSISLAVPAWFNLHLERASD